MTITTIDAVHRHDLPQTKGRPLLADAGLETVLLFQQGWDLPHFASFPLVDDEKGRAALTDYFRSFAVLARSHGTGVVLESPTWRASADWGALLGYDRDDLRRVNTDAIGLIAALRPEFPDTDIVVSGCAGPRGDGYDPGAMMTVDQARTYHRDQIEAFEQAGADLVSLVTATYVEEAIGFVLAAREARMPTVVSFTVETDGALPTGQALRDAVEQVEVATDGYAVSYGVNCAHPDHFDDVLASDAGWIERIGLVRANASRMSHEELDNAEELDDGDPGELGRQFASLRDRLPNLVVLGGCCGTDHRHIAEIGKAVFG